MFNLDDYDYNIDENLIAQHPAVKRDNSKLLFLSRKTGDIQHHRFSRLPDLFLPTDVLVVNNTKVIPGRLFGHKETGGKVELLILNYGENNSTGNGNAVYKCFVKSSKRSKPGTLLYFKEGLKAKVLSSQDEIYKVEFLCGADFSQTLEKIGEVALPPYIKKNKQMPSIDDKAFYQTVYAAQKGAIAAPTAGLHFSEDLLERIRSKGINVVEITLHVGYGTFIPVRVPDIRNHKMHSERYTISKTAADIINSAKSRGSRIIAVGSTSMRTLEYSSDKSGKIIPGSGLCDLFIYPGYRFKAVDAMVTNFHLPKSTLLMLVCAFAGHDNIFRTYKAAIDNKYRFYSYGDAMFIV